MKQLIFLTTLAVALATLASCGNEPAMELCDDGSPGKTALPETKDQALVAKAVKARDFFYPKGSRASAAGVTVGHYVTNSSRSATDTVLSVVNFANGQGFVILTDKADSPEILAVTDEGTLNLENIDNPSLKLFVDNAVENLQGRSVEIIERPQKPLMYIMENTYDTIFNIEPMIKVRWGQGSPYNRYCPVINGKKTPTGCGPIAVAQVMSYYQRPQSFYFSEVGGDELIYLNWSKINKHISSGVGVYPAVCGDNEYCHDALAGLVRQLGLIMNANYRVDGTGVFMTDIQRALSVYGYTTNYVNTGGDTEKVSFDGTSIWILGAATETGEGRDGGGHAFIVDGRMYIKHHSLGYIVDPNVIPPVIKEIVQDNTYYYDYVHINWGWDGTSNGYYFNGVYNSNSPKNLDVPEYGYGGYNFTKRFRYITASFN